MNRACLGNGTKIQVPMRHKHLTYLKSNPKIGLIHMAFEFELADFSVARSYGAQGSPAHKLW